jgi:hypothetical protein
MAEFAENTSDTDFTSYHSLNRLVSPQGHSARKGMPHGKIAKKIEQGTPQAQG